VSEYEKLRLTTKLENLLAEQRELFDKAEPIKQRLVDIYEEIQSTKSEIDTIRIAESSGEVDVDFILTCDHIESRPAYKERQRQIGLLGLYGSGYWPETEQNAVQVHLIQNDDATTERAAVGLELLLPKMKVASHGYKPIGILEHTLSQHCSWTLGVAENGEAALLRNWRVSKTFPDLRSLLRYCQEHHYYQRRKGHDD
jgi:hypothetical protein